MDIKLIRAGEKDAERLWKMQVEAFSELYEKYRDGETNPAAEPQEKTLARLGQPFTYFYFILADGDVAGAVRVVDKKDPGQPKRISPIFIMPPYRNRGIAVRAVAEVEKLHGALGWELETIMQEEASRRLYEKAGYLRTETTRKINDKMTLVVYKKG